MTSNEPGSASLRFCYASVFWLIVPGVFGLILATFLYVPAVADELPLSIKPYLSFGRLRPTHVNLAIFGWLSQVYYAGILFVLPRLLRTQLYSERLAHVNWWL